ncbi:unnamed protein product [Heligmosomoides polygyrus]|uniref:Secreted protein n=1 Tax=Heligmosomoides polygyrus TaxID=6339 RepID=A0A183GJ27_HELPZ|nr:unnamed protein product [Heligmosomoides polygyrus]
MVGDGEHGGLSPRLLLNTANMLRQQSDTTGVRRLMRGVAIEDDRPQTSQVREVRSVDILIAIDFLVCFRLSSRCVQFFNFSCC